MKSIFQRFQVGNSVIIVSHYLRHTYASGVACIFIIINFPFRNITCSELLIKIIAICQA